MKNNKVIYALTIDDIQTVANEAIDRDLSPEEIKKIMAPIAEKINWYDAIEDSINEVIK
jgi:hypothetical protein